MASEREEKLCEDCELRPPTEFYESGVEVCAFCALDRGEERLTEAGKRAIAEHRRSAPRFTDEGACGRCGALERHHAIRDLGTLEFRDGMDDDSPRFTDEEMAGMRERLVIEVLALPYFDGPGINTKVERGEVLRIINAAMQPNDSTARTGQEG